MEAQVKIAKQRKRRGEVLTDSGRKRKKDESNKRTNLTRISIGVQYERWMKVKNEQALITHAEVAKLLLDW